MSQSNTADEITICAENIGGIDSCDITFTPGVTVLEGRNATGRTSLLNALAGALGGSPPSLRSDAEHGRIELSVDGQTFNQDYTRTQNGIETSGESFSTRDDLIDLFVRLTEDNPARRAIIQDGDLRDIIMRPVDTDAIQRRIEELESERNQLGQRIREIERQLEKQPALESRRVELQGNLKDLDQEITELREQLEEFDTNPEEAEAVEEALESLEERKQEITSVQNRIQTQQETIESLRDERKDLQKEADALETSENELTQVDTELSELTTRERSLATTINDLSAIVDFNDDLISGGDLDAVTAEKESQSPLSQLDPMSQSVRCWTCGSDVQRNDISERLDELRDVVDEKRQERADVQSRIKELRSRQQNLQQEIDRQEAVNRRLEEVSAEIQRRKGTLESLKEQRDGLREQLSELESYIEENDSFKESELVSQYQQLSELEYDRGQLEEELSSVRSEIAELDRLEEERDQIESQQQEIREELKSQRTQIRELEESAIEAFNEHMTEILDILEYRNIARVWIQRREGTKFESSHGGYRGGSATRFDLHIVRETDDGSGYEDTVANLSESEREVIGLIVGLAGFLVHDVYEVVPLMLLDSLEAIDSQRIAALVDYFSDFVPYLLIALLPEDAATLDDAYSYVTADALTS